MYIKMYKHIHVQKHTERASEREREGDTCIRAHYNQVHICMYMYVYMSGSGKDGIRRLHNLQDLVGEPEAVPQTLGHSHGPLICNPYIASTCHVSTKGPYFEPD